MRKIFLLAVAFMALLIGITGAFAPPAAADTECTIPTSFYLHCARYCMNACGGEVICVSPTLYDCVCYGC